MTQTEIAKVCHEVNKAYCETLGDRSQPTWEQAPEWQRNSAMCGVDLHLNNPHAGPEASHESWMTQKIAEGWIYGEEKDPELKTHPCLVPFEDLPKDQQAKDFLFRAVVHACKSLCIIGVIVISGCITPYQEPSGRYIRPVQGEIRSAFGTNQSFARLERCDGPEKKPWYFVDKDFRVLWESINGPGSWDRNDWVWVLSFKKV